MNVGIIGAMEPEVKILREAMQNPQVLTKAGFTFYTEIGRASCRERVC